MPSAPLSTRQLNRALLARQFLLEPTTLPALDVVDRLGGMQAQEPRPPFIGLWSRIRDFRREELLSLVRDRKVVRATAMRGTLHLLTTEQYTELRGPIGPMLGDVLSILGQRAKNLNLAALVETAQGFVGQKPMTFTEIRAALADAFPDVEDERAMGFVVRMLLPLVIVPEEAPWGFRADPRFIEASTWLGQAVGTGGDLRQLVRRYLRAFGPATVVDAQAWSGVKGLRPVFEEMRSELIVLRDERKRELFDLPDAPRPPEDTPAPIRFIADYDNLILSHNDRTRIIADEHRPKVVSRNLRVAATFLVDGFVAGTWKTSTKKDVAALDIQPFVALSHETQVALEEEGDGLLRFLEAGAKSRIIRFTKLAA